eukprot:357937-Pyramimonas_sp.AAC.1
MEGILVALQQRCRGASQSSPKDFPSPKGLFALRVWKLPSMKRIPAGMLLWGIFNRMHCGEGTIPRRALRHRRAREIPARGGASWSTRKDKVTRRASLSKLLLEA